MLSIRLAKALLLSSILSVTSGYTATSTKGTVLYKGSDALYKASLQDWKPVKIEGTKDLQWARFSPDGKLIGALGIDKKSVYVMFADGSGLMKLGADADASAHTESRVVEWVKKGKFTYELAFPKPNSLQSYEVVVDFQGKSITKGQTRTIATDLYGFKNDGKTKVPMNGAFDIVGNRIIARLGFRAVLFTAPNFETVVKTGDAYAWPKDVKTGLHSCFHTLSVDGQWVQLNQSAYPDEFPDEKDHQGFILFPWREPGGKMPILADDYIYYYSPGSTKVRNYRWTNDPRVIVAHGQSNSTFYVVDLSEYPPKRKSGSKEGAATWTGYSTGVSESWGVDLWVGDAPTGMDPSSRAKLRPVERNGLDFAWEIPSGMEAGRLTLYDLEGRIVRTLSANAGRKVAWNAPKPGIYFLKGSDGLASINIVLTAL